MAVICDFDAYRSVTLLREFSRQTKDAVSNLGDLIENNNALKSITAEISKVQHANNVRLKAVLAMLNDSHLFASQCALAWDLNDLDEMVAQRDELLLQRASLRNRR